MERARCEPAQSGRSGSEPRRFALPCQQWGNMRSERHTPASSFRIVTEVAALLFSLFVSVEMAPNGSPMVCRSQCAPKAQQAESCCNADGWRRVRATPRIEISFSLRKRPSVRVIVSRVVAVIEASSSSVNAIVMVGLLPGPFAWSASPAAASPSDRPVFREARSVGPRRRRPYSPRPMPSPRTCSRR